MCKKLSGWLISKVCLCASIPYTSLQLATHFSVASDAEDVHDKDIWAPLVMTVQNFFGLHSQPAYNQQLQADSKHWLANAIGQYDPDLGQT